VRMPCAFVADAKPSQVHERPLDVCFARQTLSGLVTVRVLRRGGSTPSNPCQGPEGQWDELCTVGYGLLLPL
jgi:hypothetical protein